MLARKLLARIARTYSKLNEILQKPLGFMAGGLLAMMLVIVIYQVVARYFFNAAPSWSEGLTIFLMLWMIAFAAPIGYREGQFAAIEILHDRLPRRGAALLNLVFCAIAASVLIAGIVIGLDRMGSFTARAKLQFWLPIGFSEGEFFGWVRGERSWIFASVIASAVLLLLTTVELVLREILTLLTPSSKANTSPDEQEEIIS